VVYGASRRAGNLEKNSSPRTICDPVVPLLGYSLRPTVAYGDGYTIPFHPRGCSSLHIVIRCPRETGFSQLSVAVNSTVDHPLESPSLTRNSATQGKYRCKYGGSVVPASFVALQMLKREKGYWVGMNSALLVV
jgi:hypothetical protein